MVLGNYNMNMSQMNNMFLGNSMFNTNFLGTMLGGSFNSIFNTSGFGYYGQSSTPFTKCDGTTDYNALAGFGIANVFLNVGMAATSSVIAERKANSSKNIQADANELQKQINAELDRLGADVTEGNYFNYSVTTEDWYLDEKASIDTDKKAITGKLSATDLASRQTTSKNCETKISELKKQKTAEGVTTEQIAELDKQIAAQESIKKDADEAIKKHNEAVAAEKAIEKREEALAKRVEKEQAEVNKILNKIDDLINKRNGALEIVQNRKIDKAIGKKESQIISDDDYNNTIQSGTNFTKAHLTKAASKFRKATTEEDREKYKNEFMTIYTYLLDNNSSEITKELAEIADCISRA